MGYRKATRTIKCFEPCDGYGGCPGHEISLEFYSANSGYLLKDSTGHQFGFDPISIEAFLEMLEELGKERADVIQIIQRPKEIKHYLLIRDFGNQNNRIFQQYKIECPFSQEDIETGKISQNELESFEGEIKKVYSKFRKHPVEADYIKED